MKNEHPDFSEQLQRLQTIVENHRSSNPRRTHFPEEIRREVVALLNAGCKPSALVKDCGLRFDQLNSWRRSSRYQTKDTVTSNAADPVSLKVLMVDGGADPKSMDADISSFSLRGNIDGLPFVLFLGRQPSQGR